MALRSEDTIVAIATPLGVGGVGIIRLSGKEALTLVDGIFRPAGGSSLAQADSHHLLYGNGHDGVLASQCQAIDLIRTNLLFQKLVVSNMRDQDPGVVVDLYGNEYREIFKNDIQ